MSQALASESFNSPFPEFSAADWGRLNQPLLFATAIFALLLVPTYLASLVDLRLHQGVNVWIKPMKFLIALVAYLGTLAFVAAALPSKTRQSLWFRGYVAATITATYLEMIWIGGAAMYGVGSHFNVSTEFMARVYGYMGFFATLLTSLSLVMGLSLLRHRRKEPFMLALSLGLLSTFAMTMVTAGYMSASGSHLVGGNASDAEAALFFGWARDGGDLRVAHFFSTHAMHFIPLIGLGALTLQKTWQMPVIFVGTTVYAKSGASVFEV